MSISDEKNTSEQEHSFPQNVKNNQHNYPIPRKKGAMSKKVSRHKTPNIQLHLAKLNIAANAPTNANLESLANPTINKSFSQGPNNPLNRESSSLDISRTSLLSGGITSLPSNNAIVIAPSAPTRTASSLSRIPFKPVT